MKFLKFNNGLSMPILGIGTWQAPEAEVEAALDEALKAGYRHIDTAPVYLNEKAIGRVLKKWLDEGKVKREELFITTKLPPTGNRPGDVESRLRASLSDLQLDYVDLYLVHTPFTLVFDEVTKKFVVDENKEIKIEPTNHATVWQKMEELVEKKLTKSIGISNFNKQQIERLLSTCKIPPANLQIEHHIYLQQPELISYCKEKGITVTAYSPLGSRGIVNINKAAGVEREIPSLMDVQEVKEIANSHGKTPAQVLLRWIVQNDICAIPKSTNAERLRQNLNVFDFELTAAEMQKLNSLDQQIRVCDFKFLPGVQKHPEFPFSN